MAKKIRFPLQMNGTDVRTIEELRENFDLSSVLGYLTNGKLVTWLEDRYYDNEAMAVRALSTDETDLNQKLMSILGVSDDVKTEEIDLEEIQRRNEKLMLLRQITDDEEIIDNVDCVAFNQDELYDILDDGKETIYLCQSEFEVPLSVQNKIYIGLENPKVKLRQIESVNLDTLNVRFKNVLFSDELSPELEEKICEDESEKEEKIDYESALNLIAEYKKKLIKVPSISLYYSISSLSLGTGSYSSYGTHITSRNELVETIRQHIQEKYDNRSKVIQEKSEETANILIKYSVWEDSEGNYYNDSLLSIQENSEILVEELEKIGVYLDDDIEDALDKVVDKADEDAPDEVLIDYQGLIDRLSYNVVRYGDGYSIYDYIENYADIQSKTSLEYVQGLFGGMNKNVTTYYCGHPDFEIISEMVNDIETVYKQNGEALEQEIREYASKCVKYLNTCYILCLEEIEKNVRKHMC